MYDSLWKSRRNPLEFKPEMVLEVLPKILNTLVVGVMGGDLYASIAALEGYMAFSHLLLTFAHDEPKIRTLIDERIQLFLTSEQGRSKSACPSLGDLIAMMIVSNKHSWGDFIRVYLEEMFDRNAKWCLAANPTLADVSIHGSSGVSRKRLDKTFKACQTSIRLVCFHKAFLSMIRSEKNDTADTVRRRLDSQMGRPTPAMERNLQKQCKRILNISTWDGMFKCLNLATPDDAYLSQWLRRAVVNSGRRGYHQQRLILRQINEDSRKRNEAKKRVRELEKQKREEEEMYAGDYESHASLFDLF
jgi:hypothetical protein